MNMPKLGMFLAPDPLWEITISWSPYHYCMDNPVSVVDIDRFVVTLITSGPTNHKHNYESYKNGLAGHSAIRIDDKVYSFEGDGKWRVREYLYYMKNEKITRTFIEQTLKVDQDKVQKYLESKPGQNKPYNVSSNSCVTQNMDALSKGGIPFADRSKLNGAVSPIQLAIELQNSRYVRDAKQYVS